MSIAVVHGASRESIVSEKCDELTICYKTILSGREGSISLEYRSLITKVNYVKFRRHLLLLIPASRQKQQHLEITVEDSCDVVISSEIDT